MWIFVEFSSARNDQIRESSSSSVTSRSFHPGKIIFAENLPFSMSLA